MATEKKLTLPQWCLLVDISERPEVVNESYRPGLKLVALGYATRSTSPFGAMTLTITEAGKEAVRNG